MLKIKDLCVTYKVDDVSKKEVAVHSVSIDFPDKQITTIIGPSGCGKTTLLKSLNRMLDYIEGAKVTGSITLNGDDAYGLPVEVLRKRVGLISQTPTPFPMNIYDNVAYGLRINRMCSKKDLPGIVEHYLRTAGLWEEVKDRLKEPASKLSIGQKQRLCIARSLAVEPEIILADEPTSALDPISSRLVEEQFIKLKENYSIVMVTHILRQAKRISDYVVFMYLGKLVESGPAKEFFNNPKAPETKSYLEGLIS